MTKDLAAGIFMLVFSIAYYVSASQIPVGFAFDPVGPTGLPKSIASLMFIFSVILIVQSLLAIRRGRVKRSTWGPEERRRLLKASGIIGLGAAYVAMLEHIGYFVSLTLLIAATALYAGARVGWRLPLIALAGAGAFWLLFWALNINQPVGLFWETLL